MSSNNRLIVKNENEYIVVPVSDIVVFEKVNNHLLLTTKYSKEYRYKGAISILMDSLDKEMFFQANRKHIINIEFIRGFKVFEKVKLRVEFHFIHKLQDVIISQETAPVFKKWLRGG